MYHILLASFPFQFRGSRYHNAVADVDSVSISPPHHDTIRTGHTVSLSKAIVRKLVSLSLSLSLSLSPFVTF